MELKSMKRSPSEDKAETELMASDEGDAYPYGLSLHLEDESLDKLDIVTMPAVGDTMLVQARVKVESVSEHESQHSDGKRRSVSLQVTDMALGADGEGPSQADKLFGGEQ